MTQSLKIECLVTDLALDGEIVSFLVTKEQLTAGLSKKADLVEGKIQESNLPDFIANSFQTINQKLVTLEESIADGIQSAKDYSEAYVVEKLIVKADLVDGKVPQTQLPSIEQYEGLSEALNGVLDQARRDMIERTDEIQRSKADLGEDGKVVREQLPNYDKIPGLETVVRDLYDNKVDIAEVFLKSETLDVAGIEATVERIAPTRTEVDTALMMSEVVQVHGFDQKYIDAGGYPFGAVLTLDDGITQVKSTVANNKNNPNSNVVGWIPHGVGKFITGMSYGLNAEVILSNGDKVKSTVTSNVKNPNIDMTGWENPSLIQREIDKKIPNWNNQKQGDVNTLIANMQFVKLQKTGVMQFNPAAQVNVPSPLEINQSRVNFEGNNGVLKWTAGITTRSIIEVFDSQFVRVKDFTILGDLNNPPLAGVHFKNSTTVVLSSNNRCSVENTIIGKVYRNDTSGGGSIDEPITNVAGKVQNGVLVTKDGRGNNDEFWLNNVVVHGATVAGFNFDGDQHIWSSISNSTANGCDVGFRLGSNIALYNASSNRCVTADVKLLRDIQVSAFGLNAEHSECFVLSQGGGSIFITGGELQTNKTYDIPFFKFENGGNLIVRDQFIENIGTGKGYIEYTVGSLKGGKIKIKDSYLQGGNIRNTYRIHTATSTYPDATIDIDNGDFFKFKTEHPYHDKAISAATTVNANANARLVATTASKNGAGKLRINTIDQHIDGIRLIDCLSNNIVDIRAFNTTGANVTYTATARVRSLRIDDRITNKLKVTRTLGTVNALSYKNISVNMGARLLDHFAVTADNVSGLSSLSLSAQAKSDGTVAVIAENMLAVNITNIASLALTVAKLDLSKFNLKTMYEIPSDVLINAGESVFIGVPLDNCQMGGHTSVASSFYADGLIYSSSVKENGVVQIAVHNKTASPITVPPWTILSVVCAF